MLYSNTYYTVIINNLSLNIIIQSFVTWEFFNFNLVTKIQNKFLKVLLIFVNIKYVQYCTKKYVLGLNVLKKKVLQEK